jgi:hypothetical protein
MAHDRNSPEARRATDSRAGAGPLNEIFKQSIGWYWGRGVEESMVSELVRDELQVLSRLCAPISWTLEPGEKYPEFAHLVIMARLDAERRCVKVFRITIRDGQFVDLGGLGSPENVETAYTTIPDFVYGKIQESTSMSKIILDPSHVRMYF